MNLVSASIRRPLRHVLLRRATQLASAGVAATLVAACGPGTHTTETGLTAGTAGTIRATLAGSPGCVASAESVAADLSPSFTTASLTVQKLRFNTSATAAATDSGWAEISVAPPVKTDLVTLVGGTTQALGDTTVKPGTYSQLRLVPQATGTGVAVNAITPAGSTETAVDVSSLTTSGLQLPTSFDVTAGATTQVAVLLDVCRSFIRRSDGTWFLDPAARVLPLAGTGTVKGVVDTTTARQNGVRITIQKGGTVLGTTVPKADGSWSFTPIPVTSSPVDVVITANTRATTLVAGVEISATTPADVGTAASPVSWDTAATVRTVTGTVTPSDSKARVRIVQQVGADLVEVGAGTTLYNNGAYGLVAVAEAPRRADWSAKGTLTFVTQSTRGKYTVQAGATGYTTGSAAVDLEGSSAGAVNFTLQ